jgi:hypothetical protein
MALRPIRRLSLSCALSGAVLLLALIPGCASTPSGTGGAELPAPAAHAEADQVSAQVWSVASGVRDVGSRLVFTFWSERGVLTLTGYQALERGGRRGKPADALRTRHAVTSALASSMPGTTGELALTLRRTETGWEVEPQASFHAVRPTEARTKPGFLLPLAASGMPAEVQRLLKAVEVPADGTVWADVSVRLHNGRVDGWSLQWRPIRAGRGGKPRAVSPQVATEVTNVVLLYAPGRGSRTLHLGLRLSHRDNALAASGWVEETRVGRSLGAAAGLGY